MQSPLSLETILNDLHKEIEELRDVRSRNGEMLARIDVRVETITKRLEDMKKDIDDKILKLENDIRIDMSTFVTRSEFRPVRNSVYGMIGVAGTIVVGAVIGSVLL